MASRQSLRVSECNERWALRTSVARGNEGGTSATSVVKTKREFYERKPLRPSKDLRALCGKKRNSKFPITIGSKADAKGSKVSQLVASKNQSVKNKNLRSLKHIAIIVILAAILSGLSCRKESRWDCFKRTGDIVTELRTVDKFDKIRVEDNVHVYITQDTVFEVKVEGGENLIPLVKTEVRDGEIFIRNDNRCNWSRSYDPLLIVHIKMPVVKYITSQTAGTIKSMNTITTESFDYRTTSLGDIDLTVNNKAVIGHMHGAGDIYIRGTSEHHACHIIGNGFVRAADLSTKYTWIFSNTTGNVMVNASDLLQAELHGSGDLIYKGDPVIEQKVYGTGKVKAE